MRSARIVVPLVALLTLLGVASSSAQASKKHYTIKYGTAYISTDPNTLAALQFKKVVEKQSKGQISVSVYPDNQLGTQQNQLTEVEGDSIQIADSASSYLQAYIPQFGFLTLPFLFANRTQAQRALNGPGGVALSNLLAASAGIRVLAWQDIGFAQLITKQQAPDANSLKGMKLRVPPDPVSAAGITDLGASPVSIDGTEVATALQQGLASGSFLPLNFIFGQKIFQIDPYIARVNYVYYGSPVVINAKFLASLPPNLQKIVTNAASDAAAAQWKASEKFESASVSQMQSQGAHVSTFPATERTKLVQAVKPLYTQLRKQYGNLILNQILASAKGTKKK